MKYIIGIDCGGTKTEAEAYSLDGTLISRRQTGFGNLIVDYTTGMANIKASVEGIFQELPQEDCLEMTLGIAGIDSGGLQDRAINDLSVYNVPTKIFNDGQLAHYGIVKGQDGITVTAGTGSVILGLSNNEWFRVGGWGHLFGDEGSAYFIAKSGIQQALRESDNNQEPSELSKAIFSYFDVTTVFELTQKVYQLSKGEIASAAVVVANLTYSNDVAKQIIETAGIDIAKGILQIVKKMPKTDKKIPIGLNGSVVEKNKEVLAAVRKMLDDNHLEYELQLKEASCAKGAYYLYQRNGDQ